MCSICSAAESNCNGCISWFQFCNVKTKICFLFCCWCRLPCYCMHVNTTSQPVSKQPGSRNSLKKKDSPWISASEQKWLPCITHMGPSALESFTYTGYTAFVNLKPHHLCFSFTASHRLCCITTVKV